MLINLLQLSVQTTQPSFQLFFGSADFMHIFKWLLVIAFALYVVFAFIVIRQIYIMRKTLITSFSQIFTIIGYVHFAVAILFFLFSLTL